MFKRDWISLKVWEISTERSFECLGTLSFEHATFKVWHFLIALLPYAVTWPSELKYATIDPKPICKKAQHVSLVKIHNPRIQLTNAAHEMLFHCTACSSIAVWNGKFFQTPERVLVIVYFSREYRKSYPRWHFERSINESTTATWCNSFTRVGKNFLD